MLSASDAVGMGLNLAIRRIVFTSLRKFDGTQERPLTTAEIKQVGVKCWAAGQPGERVSSAQPVADRRAWLRPQVAGRAGRYGSRYPRGTVTALCSEDLAVLAGALQQPSDELEAAYLFPSLAQLEMLHGQHPGDSLPALLHRFAEAAQGSLERTHYRCAGGSGLERVEDCRALPMAV